MVTMSLLLLAVKNDERTFITRIQRIADV